MTSLYGRASLNYWPLQLFPIQNHLVVFCALLENKFEFRNSQVIIGSFTCNQYLPPIKHLILSLSYYFIQISIPHSHFSRMNQENRGSYFLNQKFESKTKETNSEWRNIFGYHQDPRKAKKMFENSTLMPPPRRMEEQKHKLHRKQIYENKLKIKSIFRRLANEAMYMTSTYTPSSGQLPRFSELDGKEFLNYLSKIEPIIQAKFKRLSSQSVIWLEEADYSKMEDELDKIVDWLENLEERIKSKFIDQVLRNLQGRSGDKYNLECQTSDAEHSNKNRIWSMRPLQLQIIKILKEDESNYDRSPKSRKIAINID